MPTDAPLIAVVDDEESVRRALGRLICAAGFTAETFSSGMEFMRSVQQRRPHCVVLDLRMPHMNGFDVQDALSRAGAQLPVVIVTGDDSPEARALAFRQGAAAYLRKPVDDAMLVDAIQAAIYAGSPAPG
ncbi:response regulator [uncultured Ramlibacter sp.]|uniref:response regulator transcription factor n=1 Tax=uncultured Ramlibacter sp. TaxID=260755 RepID=UPI0026256AD8|nr:response regulator [uncultured Ramlibacter sp.]